MYRLFSRTLLASLVLAVVTLSFATFSTSANRGAILTLGQRISSEPLLAGDVTYRITIGNSGTTPVTDKAYNLTITDTLPAGVTYQSASIAPTAQQTHDDGSTVLIWDNIADVEVNEELVIDVTAVLSSGLTSDDSFANTVDIAANEFPDNSGAWLTEQSVLIAQPQAIDIELEAIQSTGDEQASGAGEFDPVADWPYRYVATIRNNQVANTDSVTATLVLPPSLAYLGNPVIDNNINNSSASPSITLLVDGSLELVWSLGELTPAQYDTPVIITFDAAIPYQFRTGDDVSAESGAFAGPMSGDVIPEDTRVDVSYEAHGLYETESTLDGVSSTPADDKVETVIAEYLTVSKSVTPGIVGIDSTVTYLLHYYVSEYYDASSVVLTDVLPDGMTFIEGSASVAPDSVTADKPGNGETTLIWRIDASNTTAGSNGVVTFKAKVDATYEAAPLTNEPIVSGDSLVNVVTISGDWADVITIGRNGTAVPDTSSARVYTRMPAFSKDVFDSDSNSWGDHTVGFTGDSVSFRLNYESASNVDAKAIVIRDFLPRGMTFVPGSDTYQTTGSFNSGIGCTSAPRTPVIGDLNGLQYLEWSLCNVDQGATWEVKLDAVVGDIPDVQPGWVVANMGKLSGHNSYGEAYSERSLATVDYNAPELVLTKSAAPAINLEPDDIVDWTIEVTNKGKAAAYNLELKDVVPADLLIANSGGSAAPSSSSYTTTDGNPSAGEGGTLVWSKVSKLDVGETLTFSYQGSIPQGVVAGQSMTNIASIAYNSRPDDKGHQWTTNSDIAELNTDDETVFVRGVTLSKSADLNNARIGDSVEWTLVGTVPAGVIAHWPVVEENNLPNGFDFVEGSSVLNNATLDTDNHAQNPIDNDNMDVRWFLNTIDNTAGSGDYIFTIVFDTIVTGLSSDGSNAYSCCRKNADNDAYIGWYDNASGYNDSGFASNTYSTSHVDRRSPEADADVKVIQPNLTVNKSSDFDVLGAGGIVVFTLEISNNGNATAYDVSLEDNLPAGLTYHHSVSQQVIGNNSGVSFSGSNNSGDTALNWGLNQLDAGDTWEVTFAAEVPGDISADLNFLNVATVTEYSSLPGTAANERSYGPVSGSVPLYTPTNTMEKSSSVDGEFTYGAEIVYTLTVPANPVPATMYNVSVYDAVDSRLTVNSVSNGTQMGNIVMANFASIQPNQQEIIVIRATLDNSSTAQAGDVISNHATYVYDNAPAVDSNIVKETVVAPALVVEKTASTPWVQQGDIVTYTVTVANVGNASASSLFLEDTMPVGFTLDTSSVMLNGQALVGAWNLPDLEAGDMHTVIYSASADSISDGVPYDNVARATGVDSRGAAIPADNSAHVPADTDLDDSATARVYGPLACQNEMLSVAYEDLKNVGWSDWDYNDVLIRIDLEQCFTPADELAVSNISYEIVARGAGYDHEFRHSLPMIGGGRYTLAVSDGSGAPVSSDNGVFGDVADFGIFGRTWEAMAPIAALNEPFVNTRPEQNYFVPGHTAELTVVLDSPADNTAEFMPPVPWNPYINVYNTGESVHLNIPGFMDNSQTVSASFDPTSPLLGYDLPLAHVFDVNIDWSVEQFGIWNGYPLYENFIKSGGSAYANWDDLSNAETDYLWAYAPNVSLRELMARRNSVEAENDSSYSASPLVADLNGDGKAVIIIGNQITNKLEVFNAGRDLLWSSDLGGSIRATAAAADITGDGNLEILVGDGNGQLHAYTHDGEIVAGWPITVGNHRILATPAIADLNDDNMLEVVVPMANGRLYAFDTDGNALWNASLGDTMDSFSHQPRNSSPVIADIDADGNLEIVVGSYDKSLYVFDADGNLEWKFETADPIFSTPTIADLDPATPGLEVVFGSSKFVGGYARSYVFVLDGNGNLVEQMFAGWNGLRGAPLVHDMDGDGSAEILIGSDDGLLRAWHIDGTKVAGWPQATSAEISSQPMAADVDGDGEAEIVVSSQDAHVYAWEMDGTGVTAWPRATDVSVIGNAVSYNFDNDLVDEIVVGDLGGTLHVWEYDTVMYKIFLPIIMNPAD